MYNGYAGQLLRVDLTTKTSRAQELKAEDAYEWLGGSGFGVKIVAEEVPYDAPWDSPENKVVLAGGMLSATPGLGSGIFGLVTKGALTGGMTQSQSNGTLGAFLKLCGYDGLVIEGASDEWVYVYVDDDGVKFESADFLLGKSTNETQDLLHEKYGTNRYKMSVYCIGPAAEKLVRFSMITGDYGHVAAHNGNGAVLGSKKIKAICVRKGSKKWPIADPAGLRTASKKMNECSCAGGPGKDTADFGTIVGYPDGPKAGVLPVKNGTTTVWPQAVEFDPRKLRNNVYDIKRTPCYGCNWHHCVDIKLHDERYVDEKAFEEPEYELAALFSSGIGSDDIPAALWLAHLVDEIGVDGNEMGWLTGWCVECFERGYFTSEMFDGEIDLHWGDIDGVEKLIDIVANRRGKMGEILGEGLKRAAETIGSPAKDIAMYCEKGNIPRGHDHRTLVMSHEYLDVNTSSSGTVEVVGGFLNAAEHGISPMTMDDRKDPFMLGRHNAAIAGRRVVEDSIGCCRFFTEMLDNTRATMTAATGHDYTYDETMRSGKKIMAVARLYNICCGITHENELPSKKYGERQPDGPFGATTHLGAIVKDASEWFFEFMGYDRDTGIPTPDRLEELKAKEYIPASLAALTAAYGADWVAEKYGAYCEAYADQMDKASPADVEVKDNVTEFDGFRNFLDREKPEGYVTPDQSIEAEGA